MNHFLDTEYTNRCGGCGLLWSLVGPPGFTEGSRADKMFRECKPRNWKPRHIPPEVQIGNLIKIRIMEDV